MKLNPEEMPRKYILCFATDGQCPQRKECLHALATELPRKAPRNQNPVVIAVDPRYIATLQGKRNCSLFRSAAPGLFARGMSRMYDEVPGKLTDEMRKRIQGCFSCRSFYFSSRKGERLVTPGEQQKIAAVFQQLCPDIQPMYDGFEEAIEW